LFSPQNKLHKQLREVKSSPTTVVQSGASLRYKRIRKVEKQKTLFLKTLETVGSRNCLHRSEVESQTQQKKVKRVFSIARGRKKKGLKKKTSASDGEDNSVQGGAVIWNLQVCDAG